jgi:hypothetical protein
MSEPDETKKWGVLRYDPEANAFISGWYSNREDALKAAQDIRCAHPGWTVAVVKPDVIWRRHS